MNIEIYTKDNCGYCVAVKRLLEDNKLQYKENKLNSDFTREFIKEKFPLATTYPVIIVDGFYIGGYNEIMLLVEEYKSDHRKFLTE